MKRIAMLLMLGIVVVGVTSCSKTRKAEKTLRGDWNIVGYDLYVEDVCNGGTEYFYEHEGNWGTASFDKKTFTISYSPNPDGGWQEAACYNTDAVSMSGDYDVTDHDRFLLILHEYSLDLGGESWFAQFDDGLKADGVAQTARLYRTDANGNDISLDLARQ